MNGTRVGRFGEETAVKFLTAQGYKIIDRNFRIRGGEIDIIAWDKGVLVFVEVKTRTSSKFGNGVESINYWKLKFIQKTAAVYLQSNKWENKLCRIDAVILNCDLLSQSCKVELVKNISQ